MFMGRRTIPSVALITLTCALVTTLGAGVAVAKAGGGSASSGIIKCSMQGKLTFSPALVGLNQGTSEATVTATLSGCTSRHRKVTATAGHLKGLIGSVSPANCTNIAIDHTPPPLSGGSVTWAPTGAAAASTGIFFPAGSADVVTVNGVTFLQVSYFGGNVSSGSFTDFGGASISGTTTLNDAQLEDECTSSTGLSAVKFSGTAVL
jgi:hypothetical protein